MKATVHACLESMMFEALNEIIRADKSYKVAQRKFLYEQASSDDVKLSEKESRYDKAVARYNDLVITKRIITEMEDKGIEL